MARSMEKRLYSRANRIVACSRLSDSGEDAKEKGAREKLFSCLCFLNSADPTISDPGTGYQNSALH